jgi:DNA repair exonuclease SbcCD ATPase subunit
MGRYVRSALLILVACVTAAAQDAASFEEQAERLRAQLREVTDKEAELEVRARQLDEDLKPENIQRSVALVGTTDAAALRDQRREQLERQKAALEEQRASLAASRSRLEAAITTAEQGAVRARAAALGASSAPAPAAVPAVPARAPALKKRQSAPRRSKRVKRSRPRRRAPSR